nr:UDP-glucuronic acid decarboxylase 2-like isoform X2 [Setaria viridis]
MASELIFRGHEESLPTGAPGHTPKPHHKPLAARPLRYLLAEQRLLFALLGMALAAAVFLNAPSASGTAATSSSTNPGAGSAATTVAAGLARRQDAHAAVGGERERRAARVPLGVRLRVRRVLVTGGAGFVGSHLVDRLLERGDSVIVVDNFFTGRKENLAHHDPATAALEVIRHDVVEPALLEVDRIYHLACPASPVHYKHNPVKTAKTSVVGTLNMLGLAKRVGARFLLTSTSEVYGDPLQHPQVETYWGNVNPIGVRSCYDEGKRTAETLAMDYHRAANLEVEGLMKLMEGEHVGPFNLGNPGEFTMLELARVVQETIDRGARIEFRPNTADDPHKRKPDIARAKQLLGWEPKVPLREGLPLMVQDFRARIFGDGQQAAQPQV